MIYDETGKVFRSKSSIGGTVNVLHEENWTSTSEMIPVYKDIFLQKYVPYTVYGQDFYMGGFVFLYIGVSALLLMLGLMKRMSPKLAVILIGVWSFVISALTGSLMVMEYSVKYILAAIIILVAGIGALAFSSKVKK